MVDYKIGKLTQDMTEPEIINQCAYRAMLYSRAVYRDGVSKAVAKKILGSDELAAVIIQGLEYETGEDSVRYMNRQYAENPDLFVESVNIFDRIKRRWNDRRQLAQIKKGGE